MIDDIHQAGASMLPDEPLLRPIQSGNGTARTGDVQPNPRFAFKVDESSALAWSPKVLPEWFRTRDRLQHIRHLLSINGLAAFGPRRKLTRSHRLLFILGCMICFVMVAFSINLRRVAISSQRLASFAGQEVKRTWAFSHNDESQGGDALVSSWFPYALLY